MKTYSSKATALRAAKALGGKLSPEALLTDIEGRQIEDLESDDNGKWFAVFFFDNTADDLPAADQELLAPDFLFELATPAPDEALDAATDAAMKAGASEGRKAGTYIRELSSRKGVVAEVWAICGANVGMKRKEVVEYCRSVGIAYGTARTQYQKWFVARANAAKAVQELQDAADQDGADQDGEADDQDQQQAAAEWEGMGQLA